MIEQSWVKEAFASALVTIDNGALVRGAGYHVLPEGEFTERKIRPSLLGSDCMLQTLKKFRGHQPQPYAPWMASRRGMPNPNTNITFARGFLGEGLVVAALKHYAEMSGEFEVIGCAPELHFEFDRPKQSGWTVNYQAHPDMLVLRHGVLELIQIKTPSVWLFERAEKGSSLEAIEKYRVQMVAEMYIGRQMGIEIDRSHLLMFTWEGGRPGSDRGDEVRSIVVPLNWEPALESLIENMAEEVMLLDSQITEGNGWPRPANDESNFNKWPCSYCQYARTPQYEGQIKCTEVEKWESPEDQLERQKNLHRAITGPVVRALPAKGQT